MRGVRPKRSFIKAIDPSVAAFACFNLSIFYATNVRIKSLDCNQYENIKISQSRDMLKFWHQPNSNTPHLNQFHVVLQYFWRSLKSKSHKISVTKAIAMTHCLSQHPAINYFRKEHLKYPHTPVFHFCLRGALSVGLQAMSFDFQLISSGFDCDDCERCPCASMLIRRHLFHRLALELIWKKGSQRRDSLAAQLRHTCSLIFAEFTVSHSPSWIGQTTAIIVLHYVWVS